jgi:anamorsin
MQRTLLLAPPSIASHEEALRGVYTTFDRATSDLTMLDRLSSGLVVLPPTTYDLVVVLTDAAGTRHDEASRILTRRVYDDVAASMKPGAILRAQDGPALPESEAILAGLISKGDGSFEKAAEEAPVLLRLGGKKKKDAVANGHGVSSNGVSNGNGNGLSKGSAPVAKDKPVISLLPGDDLDDLDDDELIDEETLLTEEDINRTIQPRTLTPILPSPTFFPPSSYPRTFGPLTRLFYPPHSSRMHPKDRQAAQGV